MNWSLFAAGLVVYTFCTLTTLNFLLQHGRSGWRRRSLQVIAALGWPVYWPLVHGFVYCYDHAGYVYVAGLVLFPGFYLYHYGSNCRETVECAAAFGKSLAWAFAWPGYLLGYLTAA